jgi:hypothetical protein
MAATAVTVLQHFFPESTVPSWSEWVADSPPPTLPDETEAAVFLGASMHTAHRLFPIRPEHDIIAHWLTTALHTAPAITSAMLALAEMRRSPIPTLLTAAQQRNFDSPFRLGFQHGLDYAHIDAVLLAEMHKSLAQIAPGEAAKFNEILSAQPDGETAELIFPPYYLWQPLCRFYPEVMEVADQTQMAYLRVPWPNISFAFLVTSSRNLRLSITARLPLYEDIVKGWKGKMMVEVNGRSLTTTPLKQRWQQISLSVDHHFLQPGLNKLTVRWPALPPIGSEMIAKASTRLRQGLPATIHPIFGELYSIKVKPV